MIAHKMTVSLTEKCRCYLKLLAIVYCTSQDNL